MATIKDVARAAGVSTATVSHVLNETRYVSEELRERVLRAVAELNYRPSALAASLRTKRSQSILLMIPDIANPFFPPMVRGVQDVLERKQFATIIGNTDRRRDRELAFLDLAIRTEADGMIINATNITYDDLVPLLAQGIQIVMIGAHIDHPDLDIVHIDARKGAYDAVTHLIKLNHRRIGFVTGTLSTYSVRRRYEGYQDAMNEAGLPVRDGWVVEDTYDQEGGYRGTQRLLTHPMRPTAIFAVADIMALGVIRALHDANLSVPDDVSVVGFDNISEATVVTPALTTVNQPKYDMGCCAAELLVERIEQPTQREAKRIVMEHHLVVRQSTTQVIDPK